MNNILTKLQVSPEALWGILTIYLPIQKVVTVCAGVEESATAVTRLYFPLRTLQIRSKYAEMRRANQQKQEKKKKKEEKSSWMKVSKKVV